MLSVSIYILYCPSCLVLSRHGIPVFWKLMPAETSGRMKGKLRLKSGALTVWKFCQVLTFLFCFLTVVSLIFFFLIYWIYFWLLGQGWLWGRQDNSYIQSTECWELTEVMKLGCFSSAVGLNVAFLYANSNTPFFFFLILFLLAFLVLWVRKYKL